MPSAKVFWSGNSQAVRLPKGFRFPPGTEEVEIHREGESLVLKLLPRVEWPADFWRAFEGMPEDFKRPPQVGQQREKLEP
ncbi:MAG TPA: AbrB/MazE/SpoVT family DNA-binding domain-containing protein [Thermoanaerobaculia bacterium]|nr:AbrB/MazE/SpoVT family DNA-binding domain-containing protein [Thermoanaerobaculia bacterium]